jgi:hypothetical protein
VQVLAVASKLPKLRYVIQMEDFAQRAKVGGESPASHPVLSWSLLRCHSWLLTSPTLQSTDKYKASEDWNKYLAGTQVKLVELLDVFKSVRHTFG